MKSSGNFHCEGWNSLRRHVSLLVVALKVDFCPILMTKCGCKQSVESAGMACQGRARNRMLRKRWIVRNPVVGENDVTQYILPQSFTAPWPYGLCLFCYRHSTTLLLNKRKILIFLRYAVKRGLNSMREDCAVFRVFSEEIQTQWWRSFI